LHGAVLKKRTINAKALARDVDAGMGDTLLMEKYRLSTKQLESVLRRLVDADLISHLQLYERTRLSDTQVTRAFVEAQQAIKELD
jgi:predicted transcriptional regulator